ncbi:hypothetical protein TNCV_4140061 [Trichonephila clavipes]|nr:hypothetical protein TNCV_4140061 [Trichonephila clavipes]
MFSVILEIEVFPRHQSLGSVKNSDKETEDLEGDQSKIPVTDASLKVEYVTSTKVTHDIESLLFGRSQDNYSTISSSPPLAVDFESGCWRGNCAGRFTVGRIKGEGQTLTSLRT